MSPVLRRRLVPMVALGALVLAAVAVGLLEARGPNPGAVPTATQVDERTMSPFCTGLTLAACPSSQAIELRATIATMVSQGKTNRQIDAFLLANYPATVLGAPRNPLAWVVPAGAVLAGLLVVGIVLLRHLPGSAGSGSPGSPGSPDALGAPEEVPALSERDSSRLAEDLRRFAEGRSE